MDGQPLGEVVTVADGVRGVRTDLAAGALPPRLDQLLERLKHAESRTVRFLGPRRACVDGEHERVPWIRGVLGAMQLRLDACPYCGGVEVRDVSVDLMAGLEPGSQRPGRRSRVLGWYTGRRPAGRQFM